MSKDNHQIDGLDTMVEIVTEEQLEREQKEKQKEAAKKKRLEFMDALKRIKGDKPQQKAPTKIEPVAQAPAQQAAPSQAAPKKPQGSYMETATWFCSDTGSEEINNKFLRAKDHLEYSEWEDALRRFKEILDVEPNNAGAHMGIFLAKERITQVRLLGESGRDIDVQKEEELMLAYADGNDSQKKFIEAALDSRKKQNKYLEAAKYAGNFDNENNLKKAEQLFIELGDYKDSESMAKRCHDGIRKMSITQEAGKAIALGKDPDASIEVMRDSLADLKAIRSSNKDIIGTELDAAIDEIEERVKKIEKTEKDLYQIKHEHSIFANWNTGLAIVLFVILLPLGLFVQTGNYGAKWFFKYLPIPATVEKVAMDADVPYFVGFGSGELRIQMVGDYKVKTVFLPAMKQVSLTLSGGYVGEDAVFPKQMKQLQLVGCTASTLVIPEGTEYLDLYNVSATQIVLPQSLQYIKASNLHTTAELVIPDGCSAQLIETSVTGLTAEGKGDITLKGCTGIGSIKVRGELEYLRLLDATPQTFTVLGEGKIKDIFGNNTHSLQTLDCTGIGAVENSVQMQNAPELKYVKLKDGSTTIVRIVEYEAVEEG